MLKHKIAIIILVILYGILPVWADHTHHGTHGLSLYGDPKYKTDFAHFDYVNPQAPKGGSVNLSAVSSGFDSLNPFTLRGTAAEGIQLVFDSLVVESLDEPFSVYGLLATRMHVAEDHTHVTFYLNKQAKFYDGTPVLASDVLFSYNSLKQHSPLYQSYYHEVIRGEVAGPHEITFYFEKTHNRELPLIIGQFPVFSEKDWQGKDFNAPNLTPWLTSGPYKISQIKANQSITYERDPNYWAKDLNVNIGINNFDTITYLYFRDPTVQREAFLAGHYDIRFESLSRHWALSYNDMPEIKNGTLIKEKIKNGLPAPMQAFVFNTRREVFQDIKVRKAITLLFDFEWVNKNLFANVYQRNTSFWSNSELAATGLPSEKELALLTPFQKTLPETVFTTPFQLHKTDGSGNIRKELQQASQLLEEAGWILKNNIRVHKTTNTPLSFQFLVRDAAFERVIQAFIQNLKRVGISASIRMIDTPQFVERLNEFDFDIIVEVLPMSLSPGNELMALFHSSTADQKGSRNFVGIKNEAVDTLIQNIINAQTREALLPTIHALDRVLLHNYYVIPQWYSGYAPMVYWNKFDHPQPPLKASMNTSYNPYFMTWWQAHANARRLQEPGTGNQEPGR